MISKDDTTWAKGVMQEDCEVLNALKINEKDRARKLERILYLNII